jgi:hypothetical protein
MFEADETDDLFTPSLTEISEVPPRPPRKWEGGRLGCALRINRYAPWGKETIRPCLPPERGRGGRTRAAIKHPRAGAVDVCGRGLFGNGRRHPSAHARDSAGGVEPHLLSTGK